MFLLLLFILINFYRLTLKEISFLYNEKEISLVAKDQENEYFLLLLVSFR